MDVEIDILNMNKVDDFTRPELKQMVMRINSFLERVTGADLRQKQIKI